MFCCVISTVEDPSQVFGNMKLKLDCLNCMKLPIFYPKNLRAGVTDEHFNIAKNKLKLGKVSKSCIVFALVYKLFLVIKIEVCNFYHLL